MDAGTGDRLRLRLLQWGSDLDPSRNRQRLAEAVSGGRETADLVVLPEAFARDFGEAGSDVSAYAEALDGPFAAALEEQAAAAGTTVVAGMFERSPDPDRPYNTLLARGGARAAYRKIHLYDSFGYRESDRLTGGPVEPAVVEVSGWQVGLMTCYDLRFPELARRLVDAGAELLVVPAAWLPGPRKVAHWSTLLTARAIENTVYVAGVAQPAPRYCGHSQVVDPLGDVVGETGAQEAVLEVVLERSRLVEARSVNPSLANRRL